MLRGWDMWARDGGQASASHEGVMLRTLQLLLLTTAFGVFGALTGQGQSITGSIHGTITDSTGAVVADVTISATNTSTGIVTRTKSDAVGRYAFPTLTSGLYTISAEHPGLAVTVIPGITLDVYQRATVDVMMRVGSVSETVTVHETTPQVDTTSASLGTVVKQEEIEHLPLNLRQAAGLVFLAPGIIDTTGQSLTSGTGNGSGFNDSSYSGAGGGSGSNLLLIDGMISRALNNASFALAPWPEAVTEFKVQNNIYDAAFGLAGGTTVNLITVSGTNQLHGSLFEYARNSDLDARNFFAQEQPEYNRHQFGGAIGGPIKRDKLFFFGSVQALRLVQGLTGLSVVPTIPERNGDFSSVLSGTTANLCGPGGPPNLNYDTGQLFYPGSESTYTCPSGSTILVGNPIPGNKITTIDPVAQKVLALYPLPNCSSPSCPANYVNETPQTRQDEQVDTRIDYKLSDKDMLFGRYLFGNANQFFPGDFSPFTQYQHYRGQNVVVGWTHTFSSSLINDARVGYQRDYLTFSCTACPRPPGTIASLGITKLAAPSPNDEEYPNFTFTNFGTWGDGFPGYFPDVVPDSLEHFSDTLTKVRGRHTFALGGALDFWQTKGVEDPAQLNGLIQFNGQFSSLAEELGGSSTVSDLADLESGYPSGGFYTKNPIVSNLVGGRWISLFAQDDILLSPNVSVNIGLRWEYRRQPMDENNEIATLFPLSNSFTPGDALLLTALPNAENDALCSNSYFISASGQCLVMSSSMRRAKGLTGNAVREVSFGPGHGNFLPRLGISWRPAKSDRLVLHAGAGVFTDLPDTNIMASFANNNPVFTQSPTFVTAAGSPPPLTNRVSTTTENMFVTATAAGLSSVYSELMPSPFYHTPTVYQWSFSVQSQLSQTWALEAAYVGNHGAHLDFVHEGTGNQALPGGINDTPPLRVWPDFGPMQYDSYNRVSSYNALMAKLNKKLSKGLWANVSYTYAKTLDDGEGDDDGQNTLNANQDDNHPRADYGLAGFNVEHTLVASFTYQLPFGRGQRFWGTAGGFGNALVGGWNVNGIITARTGFPFTVVADQDYSASGSFSPRPDRVCNGSGAKQITNWFNQSCFTTAALAQALANGKPRFGDSGRNILIGPGFQEWDLSLTKQTKVNERFSVEFTAEAFNLFNHPNFSNPDPVIGSSTYDTILSALPSREIQVGLKVTF